LIVGESVLLFNSGIVRRTRRRRKERSLKCAPMDLWNFSNVDHCALPGVLDRLSAGVALLDRKLLSSIQEAASNHRGQAMYHQRRDFTQLAENRAEPSLTFSGEPLTKREGFFAALLNALHESRRLQARRVFRQYQHLITKEHDNQSPEFRL
jgi:hypothetical protein